MTPEEAAALRKSFPKESIGKLPKGGAMLDFVGHAAITDRLLAVDPLWTWEPFAVDDDRITTPQQKNLRRLLADYGLGGSNQRDEVLALATEVVGRPIASSTELTRGEASKLIDHLAKSLGELPQPEETS
jgi:hypothetical protein